LDWKPESLALLEAKPPFKCIFSGEGHGNVIVGQQTKYMIEITKRKGRMLPEIKSTDLTVTIIDDKENVIMQGAIESHEKTLTFVVKYTPTRVGKFCLVTRVLSKVMDKKEVLFKEKPFVPVVEVDSSPQKQPDSSQNQANSATVGEPPSSQPKEKQFEFLVTVGAQNRRARVSASSTLGLIEKVLKSLALPTGTLLEYWDPEFDEFILLNDYSLDDIRSKAKLKAKLSTEQVQ